MVDTVKNMVSRMDPQQVRPNKPHTGGSVSPAVNSAATSAASSVELKQSVIKDLASQPPINLEAVNNIKNAIAKGEYPVNLDRVSDALMDAFRDLKS
jgi:negative regulator of flagellin synthesis FlgM